MAALPASARERTERLFEIRIDVAHADPPPAMAAWVREHFGSIEAVREQRVVRVLDRITLDGTIFAPLRARRPIDGGGGGADDERLAAEIAATLGDPFCTVEDGTPAASWGRVRGRNATSGANIAAYDANHGVLVFDAHDPLAVDATDVAELLALGRRWADAARSADPPADRYLFIWNCLWRAGGSVIHGHAQVLLGHGRHHARLERWRRDAATYEATTGSSYLDDVLTVHGDLGLALDLGPATLMAPLVPVKERELWVVAKPGVDDLDPGFGAAAGRVLAAYRNALGVRAFNVALWRSPLDEPWPELRPLVRLVDRGAPFRRPSDVASMELFATPVVGADPFAVIAGLRAALEDASAPV